MSKHTPGPAPGPWTYKLKNAGNGFLIRSADEIAGDIADVYMTNDKSIAEGRARLIAAAPALLETCKELLAIHSADCGTPEEFRERLQKARLAAHNAIARCEGEK